MLGLVLAGTAAAAGDSLPNDPFVARQWYLGRDHALDTFDAAKQLFTVRVAVIDSGVDLGHPELKNRVVAHRSFVGGTVADTIGHGTFVAGEIAAIADNARRHRGPRAVRAPRRGEGRPGRRDDPAAGRGAGDPLGRAPGRARDQPQPRQHA